jgi:hypothetical protein
VRFSKAKSFARNPCSRSGRRAASGGTTAKLCHDRHESVRCSAVTAYCFLSFGEMPVESMYKSCTAAWTFLCGADQSAQCPCEPRGPRRSTGRWPPGSPTQVSPQPEGSADRMDGTLCPNAPVARRPLLFVPDLSDLRETEPCWPARG